MTDEALAGLALVQHDDTSIGVGHTLWHAGSLPSTNQTLRRLFADGKARHGSVVVANEQSAGRGRRGRTWQASPGAGLLCSVVLAPVEARLAYCLAAIAVRDAIASTVDVRCDIKWPNDVLIEGNKVAGILIEQLPSGAIVGMGINTNMSTLEIARIGPEATSLAAHLERAVDNAALLENLLVQLEAQYMRSRRAPDVLFQEWRSSLVTLGKVVEVETVSEKWVGQAVDIAADGSLLVRNQNGIVRVYAADVRIRTP